MSKTISPPKPSRVSVPVSTEVLEAFQRLAKAGNTSTGKAMAQWLEDTIDAAQFMAQTMEKARAAPRMVAQELHAYALGLSDETSALIEQVREKGRAARRSDAQASVDGPGAAIPPSCNTGGKLTKVVQVKRGGKSS